MPPNQPQSSVSFSSEEEDEEVESDNEGKKQGEKGKKEEEEQQESSSSEEEEEDSSSGDDAEEVEKLPTKPNTQLSLQKPIPNTQTSHSQEPVNHLISETPISNKQPSSAKPIVELKTPMPNKQQPSSSKPIDGKTSKSNKTSSSAVVVASAKRRVDAENTNQNDSKKKKKLVALKEGNSISKTDDIVVEAEKGKRLLIERVFSNKDEIVVLKGLVDLKKKGISINSNNNMNDLFDLVKGLLGFKANVNQLNNKVQRLHHKFHNNAKRAKQPREIPKISNPHELESFKLSNEIWGDEIGKNGALEDNQSGMALRKKKILVSQAISPMVDLAEEENNVIGCQYQYLDQSLKPQNYLALPVPPACLGEIAAKNGWEMFGSSKARAFDQKWKSLIIKETEAYMERVALVQEQTRWMLDVHNSSDS